MTAAAQLSSVPDVHRSKRAPAAAPTRPARRTVNARSIVTVGALSASVAVFVVAMLTSAASLYEIAVAEHLAAPWGLPVVLDLLATASAAVAWVTRSWGARLAAAVAFATSLGLQVSHVYTQGPTAWVVHSAAPVSAVVMFEVALILAGRTRTEPVPVPEPAEPVEATPVPEPAAPEPAVALATVTPAVRRPAPIRRPVERPAERDVLAEVRKALADLGVTAHEATRDQVLKHMRPGAPHVTKVGAALKTLREENP